MNAVLRGSCYCRRVRFELRAPSKWVAHCHCVNCRRAHGAGFVTWAGFDAAAFTVLDGGKELTDYLTDTGATRSFCSSCGTTMLYRSPRWKDEVHVAVACLEEGPDRPVQAHAYADRAPDWCPIHDQLPRCGGESGTEPL